MAIMFLEYISNPIAPPTGFTCWTGAFLLRLLLFFDKIGGSSQVGKLASQ